MIILLHPYWQHLLQCYEYRFETRFDLSNGTEYLGTGLFRRTVLRCFGVLKKKDIYIYIYIYIYIFLYNIKLTKYQTIMLVGFYYQIKTASCGF